MKVSGSGEVFLADQAQDVHLISLENDQVTCNGANLLAFDAGIDWDIQRTEGGMAGALAGGLYNIALVRHRLGRDHLRRPSGHARHRRGADLRRPATPRSCWSSGVQTNVKADVNLKTMIGRGSGETIQIAFTGEGWVLVQPSEGKVTPTARGRAAEGAAGCSASSGAEPRRGRRGSGRSLRASFTL